MNLARRILYRFVRPLVVTEQEERTLAWAHAAAPHAELIATKADLESAIAGYRDELTRVAAADIALDGIVRALEEPQRFMPDPGITPAEAKAWEAAITSEVGVKIDTAMINWTQQQCQAACAPVPTSEREYAAGFARGTVVAWQMAKTLSRLVLANEHQSETDATPAGADLEHPPP
jgi:hypothetical protein